VSSTRHSRLIVVVEDNSEVAEAMLADYYFNKPVDLPALFTLLDTPPQPGAAVAATAPRVLETVDPLRVLLIDDHADLSAATAALLRREGLEVRSALSGREGLELAPDFKPQLTLCDLNLPDMMGHEVIHLLRSNPLTRHTYTVVLTALSNEEVREFNREAERMGIDEFMPKPLMTETVRTLVTKVKRKQFV
jgi:CheY-like chemotaxis protein